jgi:hypothetical protein
VKVYAGPRRIISVDIWSNPREARSGKQQLQLLAIPKEPWPDLVASKFFDHLESGAL